MEEQRPLVSVIIATYNWSSVLRCAMESVRGQTFQDFEILVIGDGCTDDSEAVAASFGDRRIVWRNLEENSGSQSLPNNAGLELARGKYVAYHGHDDVWWPTHLELLVGALEGSDADLAHTWTEYIGPAGTGVRFVRGVFGNGRYGEGAFLPPSSIMHKREAGRKVGGWRDYKVLESPPDVDFLERMWAQAGRFATVEALTVFKFPSAWRRNSYVERPCHEQAACLKGIREDPEFVKRELMEIVRAYETGKTAMPKDFGMPEWMENREPGAYMEQVRALRGLERKELPAVPHARGTRKLLWKSKRELQRVLRGLARRLGD